MWFRNYVHSVYYRIKQKNISPTGWCQTPVSTRRFHLATYLFPRLSFQYIGYRSSDIFASTILSDILRRFAFTVLDAVEEQNLLSVMFLSLVTSGKEYLKRCFIQTPIQPFRASVKNTVAKLLACCWIIRTLYFCRACLRKFTWLKLCLTFM